MYLVQGGKPEWVESVEELLDPLPPLMEADPALAAQRDLERYENFAARHNASHEAGEREQARAREARAKKANGQPSAAKLPDATATTVCLDD